MKKDKLLLLLFLMVVLLQSCTEEDHSVPEPAKNYATLKEALETMDEVVKIDDDHPEEFDKDFKEVYKLAFRQPLDHANPDQTFEQLVVIKFCGFDRPTILVTLGYYWRDWKGNSGEALTSNLDANVVMVEHRNYGKSKADDPQWAYQTSWQASTDLHAVYSALKPVLRGKWMSTGVSKDGETSVDYCYYYPKDMDLCTAFCSPFLTSLYDLRCGKYMLEQSGTEEERQTMKAGIRRYLKDGEQGLYKIFCDSVTKRQQPVPSFSEYVYNVFEAYFSAFSYYRGENRDKMMPHANDAVDVLFKKWYDLLESNRDPTLYTYIVDCYKEQGFYVNDYEQFGDLLDGTSFDKTKVNLDYLEEKDRWIESTYDNSQRLRLLNEFLPQTTTPTLLVYSKDDPWTGARPEHINPVTTKMIINPNGIHLDNLNTVENYTLELAQEIMSYIRRYIY